MAELISYQHVLPDGTMTGGEPDAEALSALQAAGFECLISLRGVGESPYDGAYFESHGFQFQHLPVSGPGDLVGDFAERFDQALKACEGKAVVFCATGNRVGAAFAIRAHNMDGHNLEDAVEIGKAAGLTRLEGFVRQYLSLS